LILNHHAGVIAVEAAADVEKQVGFLCDFVVGEWSKSQVHFGLAIDSEAAAIGW
jgi:hypothetical protein